MKKDSWSEVKEALEALVLEVSRVGDNIRKARLRMDKMRQLETPSATDLWSCETLPTEKCPAKWDAICERLLDSIKTPYSPILVNHLLPQSPLERFQFLKDIRLTGLASNDRKVCLYSHTYKNNIENLHFMWLCDNDPDEQRRAQKYCEDEVPVYHSRMLKRKFMDVADTLSVTPCKAMLLYKLATDDASAARTSAEDAIDKRLEEYVSLKDESIVYDLRAVNGKAEIYSEFFNKEEEVINTEVSLAVDERRHDQVVHLAKAMSVQDLYK